MERKTSPTGATRQSYEGWNVTIFNGPGLPHVKSAHFYCPSTILSTPGESDVCDVREGLNGQSVGAR